MSLGPVHYAARFSHPSPVRRGPHSSAASPLTPLERSAIVSTTLTSALHRYDMRLPASFVTNHRRIRPSAPIHFPTACA